MAQRPANPVPASLQGRQRDKDTTAVIYGGMGMETRIQQYEKAKNEFDKCSAWAALVGKPYIGGGGGVGELKSLHLKTDELGPTIYYQHSDGAKNYHPMPNALAQHLVEAIKARFSELLADALERQKAALKESAKSAVEEHSELMKAAGIFVDLM